MKCVTSISATAVIRVLGLPLNSWVHRNEKVREERKDEEREKERWEVEIRERQKVSVNNMEEEIDGSKLKCSVSSPLPESMQLKK